MTRGLVLGYLIVGALGYLWYRSYSSPVSRVPPAPKNVNQQLLGSLIALAPKSDLQTPQASASVSSTPAMASGYTVVAAPLAPGWAMMRDPLVQVPGTVPPTVPPDASPPPIQYNNAGIYYV